MKNILLAFTVATFLFGCGGNQKKATTTEKPTAPGEFAEITKSARTIFGALPAVAENPSNPITPEKVALGKALYFDTRLSKDNTQSCNTCHNLETYGVDNKPTSPGNNGGLGERNSPTVLNAAFHMAQFWDGREPDVEAQAGGPILNPVEMEMPDEASVVKRLSAVEDYQQMFAAAFPDQDSPITYDNLKKAIGAFERKLVTPSRFDEFMKGNDQALTSPEKKGLQTFVSSGCITCHAGNMLGGHMYQKFGLFGNYWEHTKSERIDSGRYAVTKNEVDQFMFKVPSLRNVEKTGPYFHDGSIEDLGESIKIMAKLQVNKDLTDQEVVEIETFLKSLTGELPKDI